MLALIDNRIEQKLCDDVLEVAWSTMWNVTDETPVNCKRFLDHGGMICFMDCLDVSIITFSLGQGNIRSADTGNAL